MVDNVASPEVTVPDTSLDEASPSDDEDSSFAILIFGGLNTVQVWRGFTNTSAKEFTGNCSAEDALWLGHEMFAASIKFVIHFVQKVWPQDSLQGWCSVPSNVMKQMLHSSGLSCGGNILLFTTNVLLPRGH